MNPAKLYSVKVEYDALAWFVEKEDAIAYADKIYDIHGEKVSIGQPFTFSTLVYGAAGWRPRRMDAREAQVHASHCCPSHGCKYSEDESCPIALEELTPKYEHNNGCEYCEFAEEEKIKFAKLVDPVFASEKTNKKEFFAWVKDNYGYSEDDYASGVADFVKNYFTWKKVKNALEA